MDLYDEWQHSALYSVVNGDDGYKDINSNNNFSDDTTEFYNVSTFDLYPSNFSFCFDQYENISYLNVSCESNLRFSVILYGYFFPFLLLITIVANSLIVVVLSRRNMASPTNYVLMGKF